MDYVIERLDNTAFALRPDYDAVVALLGGEPPLGVPQECTFEWAWNLAVITVARQNRESAAALAARPVPPVAKKALPRVPRKSVPRKRTARKPSQEPPA